MKVSCGKLDLAGTSWDQHSKLSMIFKKLRQVKKQLENLLKFQNYY